MLQLVAKAFPQQAAVDKVAEVATEFWRAHPHKHIAIHCAYGEAAASLQLQSAAGRNRCLHLEA